MQAYVYKQSGKPSEVLKLSSSQPMPVPSGEEILIKVDSVALNALSWKLMGNAPFKWMQKKPAVPEMDLAGTVVGGQLKGSGFAEGDAVFGTINLDVVMKTGRGALAEYALVDPAFITKKPRNLSFEEASGIPNGGSGGVGALAIQIAKSYGAYVVSTTSPSSQSIVSTLGADELIDYHAVDLPAYLRDNYGKTEEKRFNIIFDTVGVEGVYKVAPKILKRNGRFADIAGVHMDGSVSSMLSGALSMVGRFMPAFLGGSKVKYAFVALKMDLMAPRLSDAAQLFGKGTVKAVVDRVFPWTDTHAAYERSQSGRAKGKVVIKVSA